MSHWRYLALGFLLIAVYWVMEFAGMRAYACIISGTPGPNGASFEFTKVMATLFLTSYFCAYLLAPIFLLSGVLRIVMKRLGPR